MPWRLLLSLLSCGLYHAYLKIMYLFRGKSLVNTPESNQTSSQSPASAIRLTEYSHGAGCGCKISPKVLDQILLSSLTLPTDANLLVGNSSKDDAAAMILATVR